MSHSSWEFFEKTMDFLSLQGKISSAKFALLYHLHNKNIEPDKMYIKMANKGVQVLYLFEKAVAVQFFSKNKLFPPGLEYFYRLNPVLKELQKDTEPRQLFEQLRKTKNFLKKLTVSNISQSKDEIQEHYKFLEVLYDAISKVVVRCMYRQRNLDCPFPL